MSFPNIGLPCDVQTFKNDYNLIDDTIILSPTNTSASVTVSELANNSTIFLRASNTLNNSELTVTVDIAYDGNNLANNAELWRQVRQRYQFQRIPIQFRLNTIFVRLIGNVRMNITLNGVPFTTFYNDFYRITPNAIPTETTLRWYGEFFIVYSAPDDTAFSQSPYYNEPLTCYPPIPLCYNNKKKCCK